MRTLRLTRETLVELSTSELTSVVGAALTVNGICDRPTFTLTCTSAVDACLTAQACTI